MSQYSIFDKLKVTDNKELKNIDKYHSYVRVLSNFDLMKQISEDKLLLNDLRTYNLDSISKLYTDTQNNLKKDRLHTACNFQRRKKNNNMTTEILNTNDLKEIKRYLETAGNANGISSKSRPTKSGFVSKKPSKLSCRPSTGIVNSKTRLHSTTICTNNNAAINSTAFITSLNNEKLIYENVSIGSIIDQAALNNPGQIPYPHTPSNPLSPQHPYYPARRMNTANNLFFTETALKANNTDTFERRGDKKKTVIAFKKRFTEALLNNLNKSTDSERKEVDRKTREHIRSEKVERLKKELECLGPINATNFSSISKDDFSRKNFIRYKNNGITKVVLKTLKYKWVQSKFMTLQDYKTRHKDEILNVLTDNCDKIISNSKKYSHMKFNTIPDRNKSKLDYIDRELRDITANGMKSRAAFIYGDKYAGASMEHRKRLNNTLYKLKI
jgi:hypothetical protein